jgi:hypothetical protein
LQNQRLAEQIFVGWIDSCGKHYPSKCTNTLSFSKTEFKGNFSEQRPEDLVPERAMGKGPIA